MCDADFGGPGARAANAKGILAITCAGAPGIGKQTIGPLTFNTYTGAPTESATDAEYAYHTRGWRRAYFLCDRSWSTRRSSAKRSRLAGRVSAARSSARTRSSRPNVSISPRRSG